MLVASWFIGMCLNIIVYCFLFCKFTGVEKFRINYKVILFCMLSCISYYIFLKLNIVIPRPLFIHCIIFCGLFLTYRCSIVKTLITELCIFVLFSISEIIYGFFIITFFNQNIQSIMNVWYIYFVSNLIIVSISMLCSNFFIVKMIINSIIKWYDNNEIKSLFLFFILSFVIFSYFMYNNFSSQLPRYFLLFTNIFSVAVIFFIINYFKVKSYNNQIVNEYDQLLKYVKKYEKLIEDKSKTQHEFKNQLTLLKGMISRNNKEAIDYINELNGDLSDSNDLELLKKLKYLPNGGIKGLVYYKIEEIYDKGINIFVDISRELKDYGFNNKMETDLKNISKILGVYLDNAIDACIDTKEKYIIIESYLENSEWVFSVSNTYLNKIEISKIEQSGYSTKGEGKGYGLSLVKDIIEHDNNLRQECELNGIYFVQKLFIKK